MDTETFERLARRLIWDTPLTLGQGMAVASVLMRDPQAHVDALVEAGVLKFGPVNPDLRPMYHVVQPEPPHDHSWRVAMTVDNVNAHVSTAVRLICHACHTTRDVANRIPIEAPDA